MGLLCNLKELRLNGLKRLKEPPNAFLGSIEECISYLHNKYMAYVGSMQLMIVGPSGAGKKLFASKMHSKYFEGEKNHLVHVREWEYRPNITKRLLHFRNWIFNGLDDYNAIYSCFLSQHSIYLLLFNLNDGNEGVHELKSWLESISRRAPYSPLMIVATHLDKVLLKQEMNDIDILLQQAKMVIAAYGRDLEMIGLVTVGLRHRLENLSDILNTVYNCAINFPFREGGN